MQWIPVFISIDWRRSVTAPPLRSNLTPRKPVIQAVVVWIVSFVLYTPVMLWFRVQQTSSGTICTFVVPKYNFRIATCVLLPLFLIWAFVPIAILWHSCDVICKRIMAAKEICENSGIGAETYDLRMRHTTRRQSDLSSSDVSTHFPYRRHSLSLIRLVTVVRMLALKVTVVAAMGLSFTVAVVLILIDGIRTDTDFFLRSDHIVAIMLITFILTVANPMIFAQL